MKSKIVSCVDFCLRERMAAELDYIAAALTIVYGERPTSLIDGETCSAAWKQYDALRAAFVRKHRSLERLKRLIGVEAPHLLQIEGKD